MSELAAGARLSKPVDEALDFGFAEKVAQVLNDPYVFMLMLEQHKENLVQFLALNMPPISVNSVFGFSGFNPQIATRVDTSESTASTTYDDLATEGPVITGLPPGDYMLLYGCIALVSDAGTAAGMGVQVNATAASDDEAVQVPSVDAGQSGIMAAFPTLPDESNTVTTKYRVISGDGVKTASFSSRWLAAFKFQNT